MDKQEGSFKCHFVSWDEASILGRTLSLDILRSGFRPELIIGIARGGLVPARMICDFLLLKDLASIRIEHWGTGIMTGNARLKYPLPDGVEISGKRILVVDDVADTGESFSVITEYLKEKKPLEIRTAALHYKMGSTFQPDYWSERQDNWKWIIYPWAVYEDLSGFIQEILIQPMTDKDIRKNLMISFGLKISGRDIQEILNCMLLKGMVQTKIAFNMVFWERVENTDQSNKK